MSESRAPALAVRPASPLSRSSSSSTVSSPRLTRRDTAASSAPAVAASSSSSSLSAPVAAPQEESFTAHTSTAAVSRSTSTSSATASVASVVGRIAERVLRHRPLFRRTSSAALSRAGSYSTPPAPTPPPLPTLEPMDDQQSHGTDPRKNGSSRPGGILGIAAIASKFGSTPTPLPTPSPSREKRDPLSRLVRPLFGRMKTNENIQASPAENDDSDVTIQSPLQSQPLASAASVSSRLRGSITTASTHSNTLDTSIISPSVGTASRVDLDVASHESGLAAKLTAFICQSAISTLSQLTPAQILATSCWHGEGQKMADTLLPASSTSEQLSASSLTLPTASVAGLVRLLSCTSWLTEKERDLAASLHGNLVTSSETSSFDPGNLLQQVGDIISSTASSSKAELVFWHVFAPAQLVGDLASAEESDGSAVYQSSSAKGAVNSSKPKVIMGVAGEGDARLQEISIQGDERGLLFALICLLRLALATTVPDSSLDVGLRLTPLYDIIPEATALNTNQKPQSWRCTFTVTLIEPPRESVLGMESAPCSGSRQCRNQSQPNRGGISEEVAKTLFKYIGMDFVGPLIKSPNTKMWKMAGVFKQGAPLHTPDILPSKTNELTREPTAQELSTFAETLLRNKKAVFFASENSIFAKHVTAYLAHWGMEMSHMPYDRSALAMNEHIDPVSPVMAKSKLSMSRYDSGFGGSSPTLLSPSISVVVDPLDAVGAAASIKSEVKLDESTTPTPVSPLYDPSVSFIVIDDDIPTLRAQLMSLRNQLPQMQLQLNYPINKRPLMSRRSKSTQHVKAATAQLNVSIVSFTSITKYRHVRNLVRTVLSSANWIVLPEVLVIPKPVCPRRLLTAFHTAVKRPIVGAAFLPIATSPSSPGTQFYTGGFGRPSPAISNAGNDFDSAAAAFINNQATEAIILNHSNQVHTPPATLPGTPGTSSPALLSSEALEYFSRAATENGGSSSTGVVLQSPDGRPRAMFFHHSGASSRSTPSRKGFDKPVSKAMAREIATSGSPDLGSAEMVGGESVPKASPSGLSPTIVEGYGTIGRRGSVVLSEGASHAMALDRFEAISPNFVGQVKPSTSPTTTFSTSPQQMKYNSSIKPSLLRMPSVQTSITNTSSTNRRPSFTNSQGLQSRGSPVTVEVPSNTVRRERSLSGQKTLTPRRKTSKKPTLPSVPPIRVLIVEDNPINQTILAMFMKKKKVLHEIASDGQQAIDKWKTGNFHLVLMDIQLPIKDGIEATKEIREMERAANINAFASSPLAEDGEPLGSTGSILTSPTPAPALPPPMLLPTSPRNMSVIIVALTASSLEEDRDKALAAGCNDFLTKPVALDWLNRKLLEWGSMAWLSGFSGPSPTTALKLGSGGLHSISGAFTGKASERRARDVAEHLHIRTDRPKSSGRSTNTTSPPVTPRLASLQEEVYRSPSS